MSAVFSALPGPINKAQCQSVPIPHQDVRALKPFLMAVSSLRVCLCRAAGIFGKATSLLLLANMVLLTGCGGDVTLGDVKQVNLFEGTAAQDAMTELSKRIGHPARALNADITPLSLTVRVQDPAQPSHIDEYSLEHEYWSYSYYHYHRVNLSGPKPVQLTLINENLEENLFDLSEVNIAGVAETSQSAVNRTALEGGAVASIHIERHLFLIPSAHCGDVEWEIHVKSDREYANAYADAKGRINRLNLDGTNRAKNLNLFADVKELQNIIGMMREVFGSTPGILKLHLNRNFLGFDARDPQKPKRLMSFTANLNGVLMGLDAFNGGPGAPQLPDDRFFAVDDVDWSCIPEIIKQAQLKLEIPKGRLYMVTLEKPVFGGSAQPLRWTVEIRDDEGENGEVEFDPRGAVMQVKLPKSRQVHLSMFEPDGAAKAILGIEKTFGPHAKLIELCFYEHRAMITAPNPNQPGHLRDFLYDEDHFADLPAMDMTPFYRGLKPESFFDLDEIEAALPPMLAQLEKTTLERLKITGGKIERITIAKHQKMQPVNPNVTIEIRAQSADKNGWVTFDMQGKVVSAMTP
ncbi:MAG: hypothetical protein WB930_01840 [Syntrophobacteraceae bacterium]